jgi:uncharacterized protein YodC (DUF2158 family)
MFKEGYQPREDCIDVTNSPGVGFKTSKYKPFEFEIGDIVFLKSGGPAMTVTMATSASYVCRWFTEGIALKSEFPLGVLERETI